MSPGSPGREATHTVLKEHDESPAPQMAPKSEAPSTDLSQARPHTVRPTAVTRHELSLEVEFNHRHVFRLPYEFIRDSCPSNFDKRRGERVFSISSVGGGLRAEEAGIVWSKDGFKIAVVWDCGSETELDAGWVFDKVTGVPPMASPGFDSAENLMWGSEMSNNVPSFDFKAITSSLRHQLQLCSSLVNRGIVLVRSASSRNRASILKEICHGVFQAESVHHSFQVRCTSEDENTLKGIPLHSERAFSETEPGFMVIYCAKQSSGTGPMIFVDGCRLAKVLETESSDDFKTLCSTMVDFAKMSEETDMRAQRPTLQVLQLENFYPVCVANNCVALTLENFYPVDSMGRLRRIAFDEQHRMRWEGEANEGGKFLKALTNAANSLYRSDLVVPQVLEEGEVVIIDTHRVLWGKVPVADNCDADVLSIMDCTFVARDDVCSRLRVLHRTVGDTL